MPLEVDDRSPFDMFMVLREGLSVPVTTSPMVQNISADPSTGEDKGDNPEALIQCI